MKRTNGHSDKYYRDRYKKIKTYAKDKGLQNPFKDLDAFRSTYDAIKADNTKDVMGKIKYNMEYSTGYKTALAEYQAQKEFGGNYTLKELKEMTTTDFAEAMKDEINDFYKEYRKKGLSSKELKDFISAYWFGSD